MKTRQILFTAALLFLALTAPAKGKKILGDPIQFPEMKSCNSMCLDGDTIYAGTNGKIFIYDVSSPLSPKVTGSISFVGRPRQMCVNKGKLFVVSRDTGAWIYDITKPDKPVLITRYDTVELATGLDVVDNCMFIGQRQNGVEFVDITNLGNPQHIRLCDTDESQSVFYSNGYLYSGEWGHGQVTVFDARDLSDIKMVHIIELQGYGDGIWVKGNRLYASTGHSHLNSAASTEKGDGHGVEIWDISKPEEPSFISRCEFDVIFKSSPDYWTPILSGDGQTLFCSDTYNGVYVVNVKNEKKPEILARYKPDDENNAPTAIALGKSVLFVAESRSGIKAIPCALSKPVEKERGILPTKPEGRFDYQTAEDSHFNAWKPETLSAVRSAAPYGDALFVACANAGLAVIKIGADGKPYKFAQATTEFASDVCIHGDKVYVAEGVKGMGVYKIGADLKLELEDRVLKDLGYSDDMRVSLWVFRPNDKYVVSASRYKGYHFLSVDESGAAPKYKFRKNFNSYNAYVKFISPKVCAGDKLPLFNKYGIHWINLSDLEGVTIQKAEAKVKGSTPDGICAYKDGKALCISGRKFMIVTPGTENVEAKSPANSAFRGKLCWDGSDTVLMTDFYDMTVGLADLSDLSKPKLLFSEETSGKPEVGIFWNGKAVVPCGYQGLLIQK